MESFQDKFRQLDRIMITQLSEFADIVMTMAKVTEMSH